MRRRKHVERARAEYLGTLRNNSYQIRRYTTKDVQKKSETATKMIAKGNNARNQRADRVA